MKEYIQLLIRGCLLSGRNGDVAIVATLDIIFVRARKI
jgi:hypothetical protein